MSGDWMKVELDLPDKPEVFRIASILSLDPDAVVGKLIRVWAWFDKHTEDGNARSVTFALADRISGVTGFGEAMSFAGWLEQCDDVLKIPKFGRHNGKTAKNRALTAKRVACYKSKSNAAGNVIGNARSISDALPREEKRREEDSVPTEQAKSSPPDPVKQVFDRGVAALGNGKSARAFIGKLRKDYGDPVVLMALDRFEAEQPTDPIPWLARVCATQSKKGGAPGLNGAHQRSAIPRTFSQEFYDRLPD